MLLLEVSAIRQNNKRVSASIDRAERIPQYAVKSKRVQIGVERRLRIEDVL